MSILLFIAAVALAWYSMAMTVTGSIYQAGGQIKDGRFRIILGAIALVAAAVLALLYFGIS